MKTERKKEFDNYKELRYVGLWVSIIIAIAGFLWRILEIEIRYVLFITIIIVLLIVIYMQNKKLKMLDNKK